MEEKYLVINAGSSSLKFSLYDMPSANEIVNGYIEKIGKEESFYTLKFSSQKIEKHVPILNHIDAVEAMLKELIDNHFINDLNEIKGIGHRIVHGGEFYPSSVLINDEVLNNIKYLTKFAALHHPGEIAGIESMKHLLPNVPQIAVFDTAFHQTMPEENYMYAVPYSWYQEDKVRKYGFHGTSHKYITEVMKSKYNKDDINLIICHIGSGASLSCIKDGKCYDTTMGLTPLDGVIMGTRSGAIDASILEFICKSKNISIEEVTKILNNQSGLFGIAGQNDYRDLNNQAKNGDVKSQLALRMLENSIIKYIAQYYFELDGKVDALVFTAGMGENAIELRKNIVNRIANSMKIKLDEQANEKIAKFKDIHSGKISTSDSLIDVYVEPTNEEYMILKDTYDLTKSIINKQDIKEYGKKYE